MQAPNAALQTLAPVAGPAAFSVGRTISQTLALWTRNAVPFGIVTLLVDVPGFALELARVRAAQGEPALGGGQVWLESLIGVVTSAAITWGVLQSRRGERPRVGAMLAAAGRRFGRVFGVGLATGFLALVGAVALVIPGLVAFAGLYVAIPAAIAEPRLEAKAALWRSWELTKGRRLRVLLVGVTAYAAFFAVILGASFAIDALVSEASPYAAAALERILAALAAGVLYTTPAVAYLDLRAEREGVGVEELVRVFE